MPEVYLNRKRSKGIITVLLLFAFLMHRRTRSFRDGELFRMYAVGYALIRFPMEFLRYQPTPRAAFVSARTAWQ